MTRFFYPYYDDVEDHFDPRTAIKSKLAYIDFDVIGLQVIFNCSKERAEYILKKSILTTGKVFLHNINALFDKIVYTVANSPIIPIHNYVAYLNRYIKVIVPDDKKNIKKILEIE